MGNERQTEADPRRSAVVAGGPRLVRDALRLALHPFGLDVVAESDEPEDAPALVRRTGAAIAVVTEQSSDGHRPGSLQSVVDAVGPAAVVVLVVPDPKRYDGGAPALPFPRSGRDARPLDGGWR